MLSYLAVRTHIWDGALGLIGPVAEGKVQVRSYDQVWDLPVPADGGYIFADIERLGRHERASAAELWTRLAEAGNAGPPLNHPTEVLRRRELLDLLRREGINRFAAYPSRDLPENLHFPVFIRSEAEHGGNLTPLLHSRAEVDRWLNRLAVKHAVVGAHHDLLVVEWVDASDDGGVCRKYSAFRIGDRIIPRHVHFSRHWMIKKDDLLDEDLLREELAYLDANPHEGWVKEIFDLARVDYGRIDYGMVDGEPQVWEINTNPVVVSLSLIHEGPRLPVHQRFVQQWWNAVQAIDKPATPGSPPVVVTAPRTEGGDPASRVTRPRAPGLAAASRFARGHPRVRRVAQRVFDAVPDPLMARLAAVAARRPSGARGLGPP